MLKKTWIYFFILLFWSGALSSGFAITPTDILLHADKARGNYSGIKWRVKIISIDADSTQKKTFDVNAKGYKILASCISPTKMKGSKLLMIDRNMKFIKPGLRKPVPISPRQKLLGKASNGDIASTNYSTDYKILEMKDDVVKGVDCYFFNLKGKNKKVTYDRIKYWISKDKLVGVKAEYYTVSGKMLKKASFEYENNLKIKGKNQLFVSKMTITDSIQKDSITTLEYNKTRLKRIPDSIFNINFLMR